MKMLNIKKDFSWFDLHPDMVYADSGATTLKPKCVIDAVNDYLINQSTNPHNSDSEFAYRAHHVMDQCRTLSAQLLNCNKNEIIFTSGATESLNLFASSLKEFLKVDDEIVLTMIEHASNLLPWFNVANETKAKIVYVENKGINIDPEAFLEKLSPKTKIVSFTGTSNVLGNTLDVKAIIQAIRKYNKDIFIVVDLAQMIGHHPVDIKDWDADFAAYSGHKMFSPPGIGIAYMKTKWMDQLKPFKFGGGMNGIIKKHDFTYMQSYEKFEGGSPNTSGIYGLLAATQYLLSIGYDKIQEHEQAIYELLYKHLKDEQNIIVYNWDAKSATLAFNFKGVHSQDLANYLAKQGIIVRSGLSCAKLLDYVLCQPAVVRATFYAYNTEEDIMKFIECLKNLSKEKILSELI